MLRLACIALVPSVVLGCVVGDQPDEDTTEQPSSLSIEPIPGTGTLDPGCKTGRDDDRDGLDDGCEARLLNRFAPVMRLPISLDWTRPANVDWYLARTRLRFHHERCSDDNILSLGSVNQTSLVSQSHATKTVWSFPPCKHTSRKVSSQPGDPWGYDEGQHFFLQPPNDDTHAGSSFPQEWTVYGHAYRNDRGTIDLQYWFFYAYNDNAGVVNHESDWEMLAVRLDAYERAQYVFFCKHGHCSSEARDVLNTNWYDATHPYAWVADGSHAAYFNEVDCNFAPTWQESEGPNCVTNDAYRWFTWAGGKGSQLGYQGRGVINVGELNYPLAGQQWIRYTGLWGEQGETTLTSGKRGPAFQDDWILH